eukprot:c1373_g1_i1.p1 GENE.c1373_g1_i1~~c1373_g1_i1.p1  ORF type:complete len:212 (+),score=45.44 c1373_g1_i1:31-636(+)
MSLNTRPTKNEYFLLRHGQSEANVIGLIVSTELGIVKYGLTEKGKEQAREAAQRFQDTVGTFQPEDILVVTSDFLRAVETAAQFSTALNLQAQPTLDARLRERFFGEFDMKDNTNYDRVWDTDTVSEPNSAHFGCESVLAVAQRAADLVNELERSHNGKRIILVAHGDTLQILQTVFLGISPSLQRSVKHMENCELRRMEP